MEYTIIPERVSYYSPVFLGNKECFIYSDRAYALNTDAITSLHFHRCLEIGICVKGSGNSIIENRLYRYSAGDIQIVLPYQPHFSNSNPDDIGCWKYLSFDPYKGMADGDFYGNGCLMIEKEVHFSGVFSASEYPRLFDIVCRCIVEYEGKEKHAKRYSMLLLQQLLIELSRLVTDQNNGIYTRKKSFSKILPALEFISSNLSDSKALTMDALAERCYMSVPTLRRYFYEFTDMSPRKFISQARLNYAEYLLSSYSDRSIAEVAGEAGFETLSCFTRAFKLHYGISPSAYRKEAGRHSKE